MRGHGLKSLADLPEPSRVRDMAAIALALEAEAQRRLEAYAAEVEAIARPEVLVLLARLAGGHAGRGDRLRSDWASDEGATVELPKTLLAQVFAEDDSAACRGYGPTCYRLLAFEVSAARRRFALYSYAAAAAGDLEVRDFAESCASKELALAAELRIDRRIAYRSEREELAAEAYPAPALVGSLGDLVAAALFIEQALARHLTEAEQAHAVSPSCLEATRHQVDELRSLARELGRPNAALARALARPGGPSPDGGAEGRTGVLPLPRLLAECERAFAFYDAVASKAAVSSVMLKAQALSQTALERIKHVVAAGPG